MAIQINPFTGQLDLVGGGGVSIGMPIGGATPYSLLSISSTSTLAQLGPLTDGQLLIGSTGADAVPAVLTSTANQVTATIAPGSITLSLPQDIAITSSPQFANLTLTPSGSLDITAAGGTLAIGTTNADIINIGNTGATVNVQGTTFYQNVTDLIVTDKRITLNSGGSAGSASNSGIELEENAIITAYVDTSADRNSWELKAPATTGIVTITPGIAGFTLDQGSHNPVTIGTANGLSLSTQALSLQLATTSLTGALSSTDWNAFTAKVDGPASSVDGEIALFNSTTGKLIKRATGTGIAHLTSGVLSASAVDLTTEVTGILPILNGGTGQSTKTLAFNALSPTTTIGDIIAHDGTDNIRVAGNSTTTQLFLSSIGNGTNSSLPSWQPLPALGVLVYYFTNTASDIATYYKETTAPQLTLQNITNVGVANGQLLATFATISNEPNRTFIPDGQYQIHLHAAKTLGTRTVQIRAEVWEVTSAGVDIAKIADLGPSVVLTGINAEYIIAYNSPKYTLASTTSRVVSKIYAVTNASGTVPTVVIYVGDGADSRITLPAPTVDITNYVPYIGATTTLNLNSQNLTTTGTITGIVTSNPITGFVSGAGVVTATDTILQTINKLNGNIATKITSVSGDIIPTTWAGVANNTADQVITGLSFATTVSSFEILMNIYIDATTDLFTTVRIIGTRKSLTDWTSANIQWSFTSDAIVGLDFTITAAGQVRVTTGSISGFVSGLVKFRAITIS